MKKLIGLLVLISTTSAFAQETHSPQFECHQSQSPETKKYLMLGNEFPQIPEIDWSHEAYFADKDKYPSGEYKQSVLYIIGESDEASLTAVNPSDTTQYLVLSGETSLFVYNSEGVTSYNCIPLRFGQRAFAQ